MAVTSAGLLLYRFCNGDLEVLLVHPGGPFWLNRDLGAWSIPKGETEKGEDLLAAAHREVREETGYSAEGSCFALGQLRQRSGKVVYAWAVESNFDPGELRSNTFELEWPRGSGQTREFPEIDRAAWFDIAEARKRILPGQAGFLDALIAHLETSP